MSNDYVIIFYNIGVTEIKNNSTEINNIKIQRFFVSFLKIPAQIPE